MRSLKVRFLILIFASLSIAPATAQGQSDTGVVQGRVLDAATTEPMEGATVTLRNTSIAAVTLHDGSFRLSGVPSGPQILVIEYLGRRPQTVEVTVEAGTTVAQTIAFDQPYVFGTTVSVAANLILDAQAKALSQQ